MAFGIELRRADGSVALRNTETFARLVHVETLAHDFNGTFSVPQFDEDRGMFYVQFEVTEHTRAGSSLAVAGPVILPSLAWDESLKEMSVTPATIPAGWFPKADANYQIHFLHFK